MGVLCGGLSGLSSFGEMEEVSLIMMVKVLSFGEFQIDATYLYFFLIRYFPFLLFQAFCGVSLYRHFCTASVYFFTRVENRDRWYLKETGKLFLYVIVYLLALFISYFFCVNWKYHIVINKEGILFCLYFLVNQTLWLFSMTLLINLLSICWGSSTGFLIVAGLQMTWIAYYAFLEDVLVFYQTDNIKWKILLLQINPLSHLVLKWHSSNIESLHAHINELRIDFPLSSSILVFTMIAIGIFIIGGVVVKKQEFIITNREVGGNL